MPTWLVGIANVIWGGGFTRLAECLLLVYAVSTIDSYAGISSVVRCSLRAREIQSSDLTLFSHIPGQCPSYWQFWVRMHALSLPETFQKVLTLYGGKFFNQWFSGGGKTVSCPALLRSPQCSLRPGVQSLNSWFWADIYQAGSPQLSAEELDISRGCYGSQGLLRDREPLSSGYAPVVAGWRRKMALCPLRGSSYIGKILPRMVKAALGQLVMWCKTVLMHLQF